MNEHKIILVGDGAVGSSYAYALTLQGIGRELGIIDINKDKTIGDALDLSDSLALTAPKKIYSATYEDCHDAKLVVITAGLAQKPGETRLDLIDKNLKIFQSMIEQIVASGFHGIFLIATNPVDILTYATWKFSGFPYNRVIGSGTTLDTARFRKEISQLLSVDARSVHAYIMGEHGDTEFPVWSHANIGGLPIYEWVSSHSEIDQELLAESFTKVRNAAYEIINKKGATFYGIATNLARITRAILNDENSIFSVSSYMNGEYGLDDVFIGAPAVINKDGVKWVIEIPLTELEQNQMLHSANTLKQVIKDSFSKL